MILCIIAAVLSAMGAIFFIMVAICTSVVSTQSERRNRNHIIKVLSLFLHDLIGRQYTVYFQSYISYVEHFE